MYAHLCTCINTYAFNMYFNLNKQHYNYDATQLQLHKPLHSAFHNLFTACSWS